MYKLEIVYKDENLQKDEIEFANKETADYYYREYQHHSNVAYCSITYIKGDELNESN